MCILNEAVQFTASDIVLNPGQNFSIKHYQVVLAEKQAVQLAAFGQLECLKVLGMALALQGAQYHPNHLCQFHALHQFHSQFLPSHPWTWGNQVQAAQQNPAWNLRGQELYLEYL